MKIFGTSTLLLLVWAWGAQAQTPPAPQLPASALSVEESTLLTQGWAFLAQGDLVRAVEKASAAMAISPRSQAALALAIEVEIARGGHASALRFYDQWLRGRALEEPAVLRRIARALLQEIGAQPQNPSAQAEALALLTKDGDQKATDVLREIAAGGGRPARLKLVELGDAESLFLLQAEVSGAQTPSAAAVRTLSSSRNPLIGPELVRLLAHVRPDLRADAAAGLAGLGDPSYARQIQPLLNDQTAYVRFAAGAALLRLGDRSGLPVVQAAAKSDSPEERLAAGAALVHWPGADWQAIVAPLAESDNALVRIEALKLLAENGANPGTSGLEVALLDSRPGVRDAAYSVWAVLAHTLDDISRAKRLLGAPDRSAQLSAAAAILKITR
ncbi:MAG: hypothetical protein AMXMBFR57_13170 [Acidimicrobiia bacterium]